MTHPNHASDSTPDAQVQRLRRRLEAMPIVKTLGLEVCDVSNGSVVVELPMQPAHCFRPGQLQATAVFAVGERLRAVGRVVHAGARSAVCQADVLSIDAQGEARLCASLFATAHHARLDHAAA